MQWDASNHAGFTTGTPWIAPSQNFAHVNAKQVLADKASVFYTYQQLIAMRKALPLLTYGNYQDLLPDHPSIWCYQRIWEEQRLLVLANLSKQPLRWQPPIDIHGRRWRLLFSNYSDAQPQPAILELRPFEAIYWVQGMQEKEDKIQE